MKKYFKNKLEKLRDNRWFKPLKFLSSHIPPTPLFERPACNAMQAKCSIAGRGKRKAALFKGAAIIVLLFVVGVGIFFYHSKQSSAAWYSSSYSYRKKLTFNNSSYGALTNQPISIELTSANFDFGKARSDGYDIVFTDSDGTTLLTYTRETFSAGSQSARFWVKVPAIDANVNTDFVYMYYGNASAANTSSAFANSFFSGAAGYLGMEDGNRTNGQTVAESVSAENMTAVAGAGTIDSATGARGNALTFNGSDEYLTQKVWDTQQGVLSYQGNDTTTAEFRDTTQDFSAWQSSANASYMIVVTNSDSTKSWGYCGMANDGNADIDIYTTKAMASRGWNGTAPVAGGKTASSYEIRKTDFQITGAVTVGAWVKGNAVAGENIFNRYTASSNDQRSFLVQADITTPSKIRLLFSNDGINAPKNYTSSITVFDNTYKFITVTYNGNNTLKLYVNGTEDTNIIKNTDTAITTLFDSRVKFGIGAAAETATGFLNGSIDEPIILPSALTADQIGAYYNNTKASQSYVSFGDQSTRGEVESGSAGLLPLAHWKFNEGQGSTAQDATANNNDGTIAGSSFWKNEEDCVQGKCVYLDGTNDWVSRAYDGDFNFGTSPFTASGWFKSDLVSSTKIIASRYSSGGWKMYLNSSGNVCFGIDDDATFEPDDYSCSSARYDDNEWHFVSAYRDTSAIYVYVDATSAGSDADLAVADGLSGSSPALYLGIDSDGASNKFTGYLDDFKIYPYARSATQIAEDYNAPGLPRGAATKGISFSSGSVFSGYKFRKKLTFANTSYGALTNQPVSVVLSSSNFDFTKTRSDGYDIIFTDSNGTTLLNFNREAYSTGSQSAKFWVKVPQIDAASATDYIYMYYGNASASDRSANFSSAFFSGAAGYWGMEDGDRSEVTDTVAESVADEDMLAITPTGTIDSATGARGNALTFNGTDEYLTQKVWDTKQGTVTASMVADTAFINDEGSPGQDFSPYAGASGSSKPYMIVVTDSTGLKAWGYIGEQGTGETLDNNKVVNGDNESVVMSGISSARGNVSQSNEQTQAGAYSAKKVCTSDIGDHYDYVNVSALMGKLFKASVYVYLPSAQQTSRLYLLANLGAPNYSNVSTTLTNQWVLLSGYINATGGGISVLGNDSIHNILNEYWYIDNFTVQQVLTPTTSGVKIYSTKTGSTQSWANVETGFNANSVSSYEIRKTDFQITGAITVGAWVKGAAQADKGIITKYETTLNKRSFALSSSAQNSGRFAAWISSDGGSSNFKNYYSSATVFDDTNTWRFISFTYDGNNALKLYVNGIEDTNPTKYTDVNITTLYDINKSVVSGAYSASYAAVGYFSGSIDEPIILPSALTADQIGAYYNNTKASQSYVSFGSETDVAGGISATSGGVDLTTGLVGEWKLDEKSGTSAADSSGNGNTGTLTNGPVWVGGKMGGGVKMDGVDDYVNIPDF